MSDRKYYQWASPHMWLDYHLQHITQEEAINLLLQLVHQHVDSDQIQDLLERDMDADGFFGEVLGPCAECDDQVVAGDGDKPKGWKCDRCGVVYHNACQSSEQRGSWVLCDNCAQIADEQGILPNPFTPGAA